MTADLFARADPTGSALPALPAFPAITRLHDWGVIRACGADAAKFLHGQLTQDTEHLTAGTARLAGYCSAKGRLLASFVLWRPSPDELLLACSADVLPTVLKRLSMFVMRAKCKLSDASADWPLWGLAGNPSAADAATADLAVWQQQVDGQSTLTRLPDAWVSGQTIRRFLLAGVPSPDFPALDAEVWRWLEVHSAVPRITAATVEQFVPQMINLEQVGGVDFQKGCYPGQEVVARSQYRGTLKRRGFVVISSAAASAGQEVFHSADPEQPAGRVVLGGSLGADEHAAFVELKLAAAESGSLHLGAADGPGLTLSALPYELVDTTA